MAETQRRLTERQSAADTELAEELALAKLIIDPDGPAMFMLVAGEKGTGKSEFVRSYAKSWPYDALIVDPTRDFDEHGAFTVPWPGGDRWPERGEDPNECRRFRLVPNRLEKGHRELIDTAILLAHQQPTPTLVVVDEGRYLFASDEPLLPGSDVVLNEGRHGPTFLMVSNPRLVGIRPVLRHQADVIVLFGLTQESDIKAAAEHSPLPWDELYGYVQNLEVVEVPGESDTARITGCVFIDKRDRTVTVFPVLPL